MAWTAKAWDKTFTHIKIASERLAKRVWYTPGSILIATPEYFLPSQWLPVIASCLFTPAIRNICSHYTKVRHRTYPICDAPLSRSAPRGAARRSVATLQKCGWKSQFLCVNRNPIRYGSRVGPNAIRYSVSWALEALTFPYVTFSPWTLSSNVSFMYLVTLEVVRSRLP